MFRPEATKPGPAPTAEEAAPEPAAAEPPAAQPSAAAENAPSEANPGKPQAHATEIETPTEKPAAAAAKPAEPVAAKPATPAALAVPVAVACGEKGQPLCPLQEFMEHTVEPAEEHGDLKKLAAALERTALLVPDPSWNAGTDGWASIANSGAQAADSGNLDGAKATCKSCHRVWRKKYKASFRSLPLK